MAAPTDAQLSALAPRIGLCAFLDVQGDPLRRALAPVDIVTPASTLLPQADADFDNRTFSTIDPRLVTVSPVRHGEGGVDSVTFSLSGTLAFDSAMMTALSDPARFRGRVAKLWLVLFDDGWQPIAARAFYSGFMAVPVFQLSADSQTIGLTVENYLTLIGGGAPSRTLLSQSDYDAGDQSAAATLGTSNSGAALGPSFGAGGGNMASIYRPNIAVV